MNIGIIQHRTREDSDFLLSRLGFASQQKAMAAKIAEATSKLFVAMADEILDVCDGDEFMAAKVLEAGAALNLIGAKHVREEAERTR